VARLKAGHYRLLDTQFVTDHLRTFGAVEVSRPIYHKLLDAALVGEGDSGRSPSIARCQAKPRWRGSRLDRLVVC